MTAVDVARRIVLAGAGTTGPYAFPFQVIDETEVAATLFNADGTQTVLVLNTGFDVTLSAPPATGGFITTTVAVPNDGTQIVIEGVTPFTQPTEIDENGPIPSGTLERSFDRATFQIQQLKDTVNNRSILLPANFEGQSLVFPEPETGRFIRGNTAADGFENADLGALGALGLPVAVSDGGTGAATAVLARQGLAVPGDADDNDFTGENEFQGKLRVAGPLAAPSSELTIASGAVTVSRAQHSIDTESDAAADDLDTLTATGVDTGALLLLTPENTARVVTVKHATGNIQLLDDVDFVMDNTESALVLRYDGTNWREVSRTAAQAGVSLASTLFNFTSVGTGQTAEQTGISGLNNVPGFVILFDGVSPNSVANLELELGDATDYSTGNTVAGSVATEGAGFPSTSPILTLAGGIADATAISGMVRFTQMPVALAVAKYGSNHRAWVVDIVLNPDTGSADETFGHIFFATTKTVDRFRIGWDATEVFDGGEWAAFTLP